jgi:hypothetical protein
VARAHSFWMIIDGGTPTAFRGREREDLVPTLVQLQRTQPGVELVWFERGRAWPSQEAAREALAMKRAAPRTRNDRWRPGGDHRDPRAKFEISRDEKRARFKKRLISKSIGRSQERPAAPPEGRPARPSRPDWKPRDRREAPAPTGDRPWRPKGRPRPRTEWQPEGGSAPRKPWRPKGPPKAPWRPKRPIGSGGGFRPKDPARSRGPRGPKGGG